ncbi:MAG: hypothetical protein HY748_04675 [Elusimicrobia bacterium]|nr:hypothetical protein [Elusimicrobiota bacterium]
MEPKKSQIPSLKDTKKPELKIKGLAAGMSLVDRVKSFRKKDLAFIAAGLAVLFLAPLVEHFLMAPDGGPRGAFQPGWGTRGEAGQSPWGGGRSPYEPGVTGLAPGGLLGTGSEIITPLNVRDPASLVMGPGQSAAQPVTAPAPTQAAPAKPASDWKDALAAAAGRSASAATKSASLPVPKVPLQGSLRGLGVLGGGGSGASWSGGGVGPAAGSGKPAQSSSLTNVKTPTGYQGVAGRRGNSPSGSIEDLKKAANDAAGNYNRGGGAGGNLLTASDASQAIPGGSSSGGAGGAAGDGKEDKAGGQNKDMRSNQRGEPSLDYILQKENAMRQLELDWQKKTKKEMFPIEMQQEVQKTMLMDGLVKPFAGAIGKGIEGLLDPLFNRDAATQIACIPVGSKKAKPYGSGIGKCSAAYNKEPSGYCLASEPNCTDGPCLYYKKDYGSSQAKPLATGCSSDGAGEGEQQNTGGTPEVPASGETLGSDGKPVMQGLMTACTVFRKAKDGVGGAFSQKMLEANRQLVTANAYLQAGGSLKPGMRSECHGSPLAGQELKEDSSVLSLHNRIGKNLQDSLKEMAAEVKGAENDVMAKLDPKAGDLKTPIANLGDDLKPEKCTDAKEGGDCLTGKAGIQAELDKLAGAAEDKYAFRAAYKGIAETPQRNYKKFVDESMAAEKGRNPKAAKLIDDAAKLNGREPVAPSWIFDAKARLEYARTQYETAANYIDSQLGVKDPNWKDFTKQVEDYRKTTVKDVEKALVDREAVQRALITRVDTVNKDARAALLENPTAGKGVKTFADWAVAGSADKAPADGYSQGLKDGAPLKTFIDKNVALDVKSKLDACAKDDTPGCKQAFADAAKTLTDSAAAVQKVRDHSTSQVNAWLGGNEGKGGKIDEISKDVEAALKP